MMCGQVVRDAGAGASAAYGALFAGRQSALFAGACILWRWLLLCTLAAVPCDQTREGDALTTKDIKRAAKREIDCAARQLVHELHVFKVSRASRVRRRNRDPFGEARHELLVDTPAQALDVRRMDQQLAAVR